MRSIAGRRAGVLFLLGLCLPATSRAQAWLPPAGDGSVTAAYQGLFSRDHLDFKGDPFDKGRVSSNTFLTGVEYGLSDLFTIDAKVAFVANKHEGTDRLHGPLDTGTYHGTIQDARVAFALRIPTRSALAIAPFIGGIIPTHDYETRGHSAPGRRLRALQLGTWVGRDLGPVLPNAYIQGQYGFAFVERVGGMSINRSNFDLEGGYAISSFMTLMLAGAVQRTHGGLEFPLPRDEHFAEVFPFHDRVAKDNYFLMSGGATIAVTRVMSVYATTVRTISGQNTHRVKGFVGGVSWTFRRGLRLGSSSPAVKAIRRSEFRL
jgi:hypothetical protein